MSAETILNDGGASVNPSAFISTSVLRVAGGPTLPRSYDDYLKSRLWKDIRRKVIKRDGHKCRVCNGPASEVHHMRYDEQTMLGNTLKYLLAICRSCHEKISVHLNGCKRTSSETESELRRLLRVSQWQYDNLNPDCRPLAPPQKQGKRKKNKRKSLDKNGRRRSVSKPMQCSSCRKIEMIPAKLRANRSGARLRCGSCGGPLNYPSQA